MPARATPRCVVLAVVASGLVSLLLTGCAPFRLLSNVIHASGAGLAPAEFAGLEGRRVAIICLSDSLSYGPSMATTQLARAVGANLTKQVKEISIVPQKQVDDWYDTHDSDNFDIPALGNGVAADAVLVVDLNRFSIYEGQTLFKGRAEVEVLVYMASENPDENEPAPGDAESEPPVKWRVAYRGSPPQIQYPKNAGITTTEISEKEFRRRFMAVLASRVSRTFYRYDRNEDMALDSALLN